MYLLKLSAGRSPRSHLRRLPVGRIVAISVAVSVALTFAAAAPAAAQRPDVKRASVQDTFDDDLPRPVRDHNEDDGHRTLDAEDLP